MSYTPARRTYKKKYVPKKRYTKRSVMVVPGYTRTGGYYGRYPKRKYLPADGELKFLDTNITGYSVPFVSVIPTNGQINLIPQGDTESSRDGRKVIIRSIHSKGTFSYLPSTDLTAATNVFCYLIWDKQCNGAAASATDVFTSSNLSLAMMNLANSDRFRVLKKFKLAFNPPAGQSGAYNNVTKTYEFYKKCNIPIIFGGTTGVLTEVKSNNLFWIMGTDLDATGVIVNNFNTRIRFIGN